MDKHLLPSYVTISEYAILKVAHDKRDKPMQRKTVYAAISNGRIIPVTVGQSGSITLIDWDKYKDVTFNT